MLERAEGVAVSVLMTALGGPARPHAYEAICNASAEQPGRFKSVPVHLTSGLST